MKQQTSAVGGGEAPPTSQSTEQLRSNQAKSKKKILNRDGT